MKIHRSGQGEPIVFLHGLLGNHQVFKYTYEGLSHFTCLSYDIFGHGEFIDQYDKFEMDQLVNQLEYVFEKENVKEAHLCALSYSAYIAIEFAHKFPDKVKSLCLIGGHYKNDSRLFDIFKKYYNNDSEYKKWLKAYAREVLPNIKFFDRQNSISRKMYIKLGMEVHPSIIKKTIEHRLFVDIKEKVKELKSPMLWLVGEQDHLYKETLKDVTDISPVSIYREIPNAGHVANIHQPELFHKFYEEFLCDN